MKVLKQNATLGIRLEYDENSEHKYRLISGDEIVLKANAESLALLEYDDLFAEHDAPFAARARLTSRSVSNFRTSVSDGRVRRQRRRRVARADA